MNFKKMSKMLIGGLISFGAQSQGLADDSGYVFKSDVPAVFPSKVCAGRRFKGKLGSREYTALMNAKCNTYFVLPPQIVEPVFDPYEGASLGLCPALKTRQNSVLEVATMINNLYKKMNELMDMEAETQKEQEKIDERIHVLTQQIKKMQELENAENSNIGSLFSDIEGATFSVTLDSRVLDSDIAELAYKNEYLQVVKVGDEETSSYVLPKVHRAPISESLYSFNYRSMDKRHGSDSIISTTIPGLEILEQQGGQMATAHVKAGDVVTGEIVMSLIGVCPGVVANNDGTFTLHDSQSRPPFSVNRTFEVQQQINFGYNASMKIDETVSQVTKNIVTHENKGFSKKTIFEDNIEAENNPLLHFAWSSDFETQSAEMSDAMIKDIKNSVFARFVDNYFEKLVTAGKLQISNPMATEVQEGGYIDVSKNGVRCWIERKWWGRRRKKCANFTYVVKEWKNGLTESEVNKNLTLKGEFKESQVTYRMVPFYFTTTFGKLRKGDSL